MKKNRVFVLGTVIFAVFLIISSATAVQVANKKAGENLEKNENEKKILDENYFDLLANSDIDIESLIMTLYNNQEFRNTLLDYKTNLVTFINNTFSEGNQTLVEQLFNIDETFNPDSIFQRIINTNYESNQLANYIQDKFEVANNQEELENNYQDKAELFLRIAYGGNFKPEPESEGLHEAINEISNGIPTIYKKMIKILDPLLGQVGKALAIASYIIILLILLFPIIIPAILVEAFIDTIEHEKWLIDELCTIFKNSGYNGLIVEGGLLTLATIFLEKYLFQSVIEIGKKICMIDYVIRPSGNVKSIDFGQNTPEPQVLTKPKYKGLGTKYTYEFKARITEKDIVDGDPRDMVQVGWDFNNDKIVDEWTDLTIERVVETDHTYPTSGPKNIKYILKDQWGALGDWSETIGIFANHAPNNPTITGPNELERNEEGEFRTIAIDPESDDIYYQWKYDGIFSEWEGPFESEQAVYFITSFVNSGEHTIKARAKDDNSWVSDWSDEITVVIPKSKSKSMNLFKYLDLDRFPVIAKILRIG